MNHFNLQKYREIVLAYIPLGFITFGGPSAHIALLHDKFVKKRGWISDTIFSELFAICQALPGPASTQMAFAIALCRQGIIAALIAFFFWRYKQSLNSLLVFLD